MKYAAILLLAGCATAVPPSPEHPRSACFLSCSGHSSMYANRQCPSGRLRGQDISINGEEINEQNAHESYWLTGTEANRAKYPKDDVVLGPCSMFFAGRGDNEEHTMGELNKGHK